MVHKWLGCLAVDGNYSKSRIGMLLMGTIVLGFLIWLIVLSVQIKNIDQDENKGIFGVWIKVRVGIERLANASIKTIFAAASEFIYLYIKKLHKMKYVSLVLTWWRRCQIWPTELVVLTYIPGTDRPIAKPVLSPCIV